MERLCMRENTLTLTGLKLACGFENVKKNKG